MVTKMVTGFESFKRWFSEYSEQYAIIGGTACDLLMSEEGMDFRATRDIDMVLIVESLTPQFGERFWSYIGHISETQGTSIEIKVPANRSFTDLRIRRAGIIPT